MKFAAKLFFVSSLAAMWVTALGWHDLRSMWIGSLVLSLVCGFLSAIDWPASDTH